MATRAFCVSVGLSISPFRCTDVSSVEGASPTLGLGREEAWCDVASRGSRSCGKRCLLFVHSIGRRQSGFVSCAEKKGDFFDYRNLFVEGDCRCNKKTGVRVTKAQKVSISQM